MSKEQKTLKSCYILDRLREWFELYGNQNHQRAEEELHLAIDELYEYQQKDRQIADLEARLAESEKDKQFYFFENGEKGLKIRELKQQVNDWKQRFESSEERNKQMADNGVKALELKNEKIKELKQQLAEKEKQLENAQNLKAIEVADELSLKLSKIHNQDKISFAIQQLEKAKENAYQSATDISCLLDYTELAKIIDNQIEELKKGVE